MENNKSDETVTDSMRLEIPESDNGQEIQRQESDVLETKKISDHNVDIEVTSGKHREIPDSMRLEIPESNKCQEIQRQESDVLQTKKISGHNVDIEVTSGKYGEIRELKIFECGNSIAIFHEEYDKLEEGESPLADPGFIPDLLSALDSRPSISSNEVNDKKFIRKCERKPKLLMRLKLEDDEGIVSKHATFFPTKIKEKDVFHKDVNSDHYYEMNSFPRGTFTLMNVKNFRSSTGMSQYSRHGTDRDAEGLCALFLELGFIVERYDNPTKKIMLSALETAASDVKSSCCACAILTHGDEGVLYASDNTLRMKDIAKIFRKKDLAGKPKLFIFQACQRSEKMKISDSFDSLVGNEKDAFLPNDIDFLYAYSAVPGYFSWHDTLQGSWFIQALCSVFREHADSMDVYRMLTRVNDKIATRTCAGDKLVTNEKYQIASIVSLMRKDLFFFPPYGPLPLIKSFASCCH